MSGWFLKGCIQETIRVSDFFFFFFPFQRGAKTAVHFSHGGTEFDTDRHVQSDRTLTAADRRR
jgi:hypothetical protein